MELFVKWLQSKGLTRETLRDYVNAFNRLGLGKCNCDFECIREKVLIVKTKPEKRVVQNYITFCVDYEEVLEDRRAKKLRKLLERVKREERKRFGVSQVKLSLSSIEGLSQLVKPYFLFQYFSGLRLKEIMKVKELLDSGKQFEEIDDENAYLVLNWYRGSKISTVAFAPRDIFEYLKNAKRVHYSTLTHKGMASKIRKFWFQRCIEITHYPELCSWMQGRISSLSVSEHHYLDLFERAKMYYPLIADGLRGKLSEEDYLRKIMIHHLRYLVLGSLQLSQSERNRQ